MDPDLLRAVLLFPSEDAPRLVLSDWLEEHGQIERAEFIRVQCDYERLSGPCGGYYCDEAIGHIDCEDPTGEKRQAASRRSERLLLDLWGTGQLTRGLPGVQYLSGDGFRRILAMSVEDKLLELLFRRGFVSSLRCSLSDWLQHGPTIVACQPVETVDLIIPEMGPGDSLLIPWQGPLTFNPMSSGHFTPRFQSKNDEKLFHAQALLWARQQAGLLERSSP